METERGRQVQEQVSRDRDWGERWERNGQEEINDASEGWSGGSAEDLAGSEMEEERMTAGGGGGEMRKADNVVMGHTRKWRRRGTGGCEDRQDQHR